MPAASQNMKIRTIYFKVRDVRAAGSFWQSLLDVKPHKDTDHWIEFWCGNIRLGLLQQEQNDPFSGSGCVPVFEFEDKDLPGYIARAKELGAEVIVDGLENPKLLSVVFRDPFGHEFELSKFH